MIIKQSILVLKFQLQNIYYNYTYLNIYNLYNIGIIIYSIYVQTTMDYNVIFVITTVQIEDNMFHSSVFQWLQSLKLFYKRVR